MPNACPRCGTTLDRVRRSFIGRMLYRKLQTCPKCGYRERTWRVPFEVTATWVLSRYSRCIRCGSYKVKRLSRRDLIDGRSNHPLSVLLGLTFAPFYHCNPCRLQYHDWRPLHPSARSAPRSAESAEAKAG